MNGISTPCLPRDGWAISEPLSCSQPGISVCPVRVFNVRKVGIAFISYNSDSIEVKCSSTGAEPRWTLASPGGDTALGPAMVRKWMEPRASMQKSGKMMGNNPKWGCSYSPCSRCCRGSPLLAEGRQLLLGPIPFIHVPAQGWLFFLHLALIRRAKNTIKRRRMC